MTFEGASATQTYTGCEIEISGINVGGDGLADGHAHNVVFSAKGTDVGTYDGTITDVADVVITSGDVDVTANYCTPHTTSRSRTARSPSKTPPASSRYPLRTWSSSTPARR